MFPKNFGKSPMKKELVVPGSKKQMLKSKLSKMRKESMMSKASDKMDGKGGYGKKAC